MKLTDEVINDIRNSASITEVIGHYIPLIKKGRGYTAVCPFHDDSNPSMCVSREKQIYTCFSCHATGNVFTFLMNYEHIDFKDALKYLGDKVGVDVGVVNVAKKSSKYLPYFVSSSAETRASPFTGSLTA